MTNQITQADLNCSIDTVCYKKIVLYSEQESIFM